MGIFQSKQKRRTHQELFMSVLICIEQRGEEKKKYSCRLHLLFGLLHWYEDLSE